MNKPEQTEGLTMKEGAKIVCFCGSSASLRSNSVIYGREYGNGKMWICDRFPDCEGRVELDGFKLSAPRSRKEQLKAYGNAIVPQVAIEIMKGIKATQ